jgi:hypothetical protein
MFWLVAASRAAGDLERAWSGALSAWVRARSMGPRGLTLRADLDQLVSTVILPERAKALTPAGDARPTLATLLEQWEAFKKDWH